MSRTTKSTLELARTAYAAAREALPDYSHRNSPRTYTQPQLLACLCVMEFERTDYRGIEAKLRDWTELREALELKQAPDFTTLCKAAPRLLAGKKGGARVPGGLARAGSRARGPGRGERAGGRGLDGA